MYKVNDSLLERQIKSDKSDRNFLLIIIFLLVVMTVISTLSQFVFLSVSVSGPSMQPTLYTGDVVTVNRCKKVKENDIIVISGEKEYWLIKRVIACNEGDTIDIKDGFVIVNGNKRVENYGATLPHSNQIEYPIQLKKGEVFYLGDNRGNSSDSRDYGTCTYEQVVGVVEDWSMKTKGINSFFFKVSNKLKGMFK